MNREFGELLREFRKRAGLKQATLAHMTSCADTEISRFETGSKLPSQALLHKIINAFRGSIPEDELIKLWDLAGYIGTPRSWQESPPAHPKMLVINQLIADQIKKGLGQDIVDSAMDYALSVVQAEIGVQNSTELLKQREWKKGLGSLNAIERNINRLDNLYALLFSTQAMAHYGDGDYLNAINHFNLTLRSLYRLKAVVSDNSQKELLLHQIGNILINIGSVYRRKSEMSVAEDYYRQAEEIFSSLENSGAKEMLINSLRKQAGIANYLGQADKAISILEKCGSISNEENTSASVTYKNWQHLAWAYRLLGRWDEAIELNEKAFDLIQKNTPVDKWEVMKAHIYLGESYRLIRNGDLAKEHYEEAQRILISIEDEGRHARLQEGMILLGLGRVYLKRPTQLHLAQDYLDRSLQMHYQLGEELMVAAVKNEIGELHIAYNEFEQALDYLLQSRDYFKHIKADFYYLSCLASLCKCYYRSQKFSEIYIILDEVGKITNVQMETHLAKIKLMAGQAKLTDDDIQSASSLFCESLKHAISFNKYVFQEIWNEISEDITNLVKTNKIDFALTMLNLGKQCVEQTPWKDDERALAKELLTKIKVKEKEIKTSPPYRQPKKKDAHSGG